MIYSALGDDMREIIHALAIIAHSPAEWNADPNVRNSPACRGGSGNSQ